MTLARLTRRGAPPQGGFTLLEVMIALAILSMALVILLRIITGNIQNTNRAKMMTVATFLARAKIVEIEDRVLIEGFIDFDDEQTGDFSNEGYPQISWDSVVERVRLPMDLAQQAQQASSDMTQNASNVGNQNPLQFMAGFMGGFMSTLMDPIRIGLEESVRRLTVRVYWREFAKPMQTFEVVTFLTDPAKLDLALTGGSAGLPGAGAPGQGLPGQPGQPGSGQPGSNFPTSPLPGMTTPGGAK